MAINYIIDLLLPICMLYISTSIRNGSNYSDYKQQLVVGKWSQTSRYSLTGLLQELLNQDMTKVSESRGEERRVAGQHGGRESRGNNLARRKANRQDLWMKIQDGLSVIKSVIIYCFKAFLSYLRKYPSACCFVLLSTDTHTSGSKNT